MSMTITTSAEQALLANTTAAKPATMAQSFEQQQSIIAHLVSCHWVAGKEKMSKCLKSLPISFSLVLSTQVFNTFGTLS